MGREQVPPPSQGPATPRGSERPRLSSSRGHTPGLPLRVQPALPPPHPPPEGPPVEALLPWALWGRVDRLGGLQRGEGPAGLTRMRVMDSPSEETAQAGRPGQQHRLPGTGPGGAALVPALVFGRPPTTSPCGPWESLVLLPMGTAWPGQEEAKQLLPRGWLLPGGAEGRPGVQRAGPARVGLGAPGEPWAGCSHWLPSHCPQWPLHPAPSPREGGRLGSSPRRSPLCPGS